MTKPIHYDEVQNYLRGNSYQSDLPRNDFKQLWELFAPLLERLNDAATDQALTNLALQLGDGQRQILQQLAQAANRTNGAAIVAAIDEATYHAQKEPRFGEHNPELMDLALWKWMIRQGGSAWSARTQFEPACRAYMDELHKQPHVDYQSLSEEELLALSENSPRYEYGPAVWSFSRFGCSYTRLPDGREIWIAGEHEDWYDPDFHIYNDVIVTHPDFSIDIYGYPRTVFPPTDFHTATLVGDQIYIIGCLGHLGTRQPGVTPVYRLDCQTFRIEPVATEGENPGWIYEHEALYSPSEHAIKVTKGKVFLRWGGKQTKLNRKTYWLDLATREWSCGREKV